MNDSNQDTDEEVLEVWEWEREQESKQSVPSWERFELKPLAPSIPKPDLLEKDLFQLKDKEFERDHWRKLAALFALMLGFFISSSIDVWQDAYQGVDPWVTNIFVTSIVPILAFILGANINNNK